MSALCSTCLMLIRAVRGTVLYVARLMDGVVRVTSVRGTVDGLVNGAQKRLEEYNKKYDECNLAVTEQTTQLDQISGYGPHHPVTDCTIQ